MTDLPSWPGVPNPGYTKPVTTKPPEGYSDWSEMRVFDAIFTPRATRVYQDRPLPEHLLTRILSVGTFAASSGNTQPWEFIVVTDREIQRKLKALMREAFVIIDQQRLLTPEQLRDGAGRSVTGHAAIENMDVVSAIVFVFWNPDRGVRLQEEYELNPDGTMREMRKILGGRGSSLFQACQNMILASQALGVSSLFTTFFGLIEPAVKELLAVPPRMFLESAIFLGYGNEELKSPRRRPLNDVAHRNTYGQAFQPVFDPE